MKTKDLSPSECLFYFLISLFLGILGSGCVLGGLVGDVEPDAPITRGGIILFGLGTVTVAGRLFDHSVTGKNDLSK
ncbi:hypothetical protein Lepto7375DRAFT_7281 [Leptolyngbya sp. PCC 7375]|nr:hypothetical protein Lepto7375DRAFT_7281 [Leptolyngbya sp. PCC 7375]